MGLQTFFIPSINIALCLLKLIEVKEGDKWYNRSSTKQFFQGLLLIVSSGEQSIRYDFFAESHFHQASHLSFVDLWRSVFVDPLLCMVVELLAVFFVFLSDNSILRVVWFWDAQKCLEWQQGSSDGQGWRPFVLENIETDGSSNWWNVGVPDFCLKLHLGRLVRILRRQLDINLKHSSRVRRIFWSFDVTDPMSNVVAEQAHSNCCFFALD